jgi:tRNA 2-thiouridine synthesizing protein E
MAEKIYAGKPVAVNDEGYLLNPTEWNKDVAVEIANEIGIELTPKHFEVVDYLRKEQAAGTSLSIRKVGNSGIVDIKGLYQLFPGGPLKYSSKIAGIPKPASCI